ncbi:hypothetical protein RMSM_01659 [Rhodopirellula maiorica SM1]|uniref:Uncharacterized protein n=1 Tax=Rhodopirellula maiorica SM1 TaxID=1265738 RepID=M5S186_9BACT|nr:hypothetical protein RMSM_01659 [Rhodopirellula maiorica SM1]
MKNTTIGVFAAVLGGLRGVVEIRSSPNFAAPYRGIQLSLS